MLATSLYIHTHNLYIYSCLREQNNKNKSDVVLFLFAREVIHEKREISIYKIKKNSSQNIIHTGFLSAVRLSGSSAPPA